MRKKCYRFFWGFLRSQEEWLNKMADQGYRLIETKKISYEFEECAPGKYRYAVEFVGEKSKQEASAYAGFLEDCGYRVLFKNLNLDFSVGKAVIRPWANKGGKIATTAGAYNRELLIVEKENDGKPFALHTTEEDIRNYQRMIHKPWIFSFVTILVILLIGVGGLFVAPALGIENINHTTSIGYVGNAGWSSWSGRYASLDGTMQRSLHSKNDLLHIEVETESGTLSMEIKDADGNIIFDEKVIGTGSFDVAVSGKVEIKITAEEHKGSFLIK